jgi:hypothetical protein
MVLVAHRTCVVVDDVEARAEQVDDLIVGIGLDRFLEGHELGPKIAKAVDEHRPTLGPCSAASPQVQRGNAHTSQQTGNGHLVIIGQR